MSRPVQSVDPKAIRQSVIDAVRHLDVAPESATNQNSARDAFLGLVEALPVAVFVWAGLKVVYANPAARGMVMRETAADIVGRRATDLVPPEEREALSRLIIRRDRLNPVDPPRSFRMVNGEGGLVSVSLRLAPMNWEDGDALVVIVSEEQAAPGPASAENPANAVEPAEAPARILEFVSPRANENATSGISVDFAAIGPAIEGRISLPPAAPLTQLHGEAAADFVAPLHTWDVDSAIRDLENRHHAPDRETEAGVEQGTVQPQEVSASPPEISALDEAHRLSEAALAASTNGIVIADALNPALPIIYVNAAFERVTGYEFDDVVGLSMPFLYAGDGDQPGVARIREAVEELGPASAVLKNRTKNGAAYWAELSLSPVRDNMDTVTHFVIIVNDVSERVNAEIGHTEAESRLRSFADTAQEWFWEFDADLRYSYASEKYFAITGDSQPDILGRTIYEFQRGVATVDLDALFAKLESAQPFSDHIFTRQRADGSTVWFSSDGQPTIDSDGAFLGYRGSARDITEELTARRALKESEDRTRRLTSDLPAMMFQWQRSADGTVSVPYINETARTLLGLEPSQIMADPMALFRHIHPDDNPSVDAAFRQSAETLEPISTEYRIVDTREREKWVLTLARPRRVDARTIAWDCLTLDITGTKTAALNLGRDMNLYRALADNDPQPVCCLDPRNCLTYVNGPFVALMGGDREGLTGAKLTDLIEEGPAWKVIDAGVRCFASGEATADEIDLPAPRGKSLRRVHVTMTPLRDGDGAITQVRATWVDVTARHVAELRRRESDKYLQSMTNALPLQVAYIDTELRYRMANRRHNALMSRDGEPLAGKHVRDVVGETTYDRMRPYLESALAGESVKFEWSKDTDEGTRDFEITYTPHLNDAGAVRGIFAAVEDITGGRQAERDVLQQDERYQSLIANTPGVVYQRVSDWQGNVSFDFISDAACEILEADPTEFAADPDLMAALVHEDDRPAVKEALEASRFEMKPFDIEHRCVTRSGRLLWLRHVARPHAREEDSAVIWNGLLVDITDRKTAEQSFRESEQRVTGLAELSPEAVLIHDGRRILFANPAMARLCGLQSTGALIGMAPSELIHPEDSERAAARDGRVLLDGTAQPFAPLRYRGSDGTPIAVEAAATPIAWNGHPAVLAVIRDVTEKLAAESALREGEGRLRQLAELSPDAIYVCVENRIVMANHACRWLFGSEPEDVIGVDPVDLSAASNMEAIAERREMVDRGETAPWTERLRMLPDGTTIHYETMAAPGKWKGRAARLVLARDITARKEMEQTVALALVESEQAKGRAEEAARESETALDRVRMAEEAKERFLSAMNEELRAPLSGMIGMAGLLKDADLDEDQQDHAQSIQQSGQALMRVLNDILDFSKISQGETKLENAEFAPRAIIDSVLELLAPNAFSKGIDLAAYVSPNVPKLLRGDAGRIRQMLFNLTSNAIKFTDRGGVTVKMNMDSTGTNMPGLYVRIADTGVGMEPERQEKLFKAFERGPVGDGRRTEGGGMGLAICQELVDAMDGVIGVESEPESGSTFWFRIPMEPGEATDYAEQSLAASLNGRQALLVGGNTVSRRLVVKQLSAFGIATSELSSGEQALEAIAVADQKRNPYHLLIADLVISDMDATEFAQRVRENPRYEDVRIVLGAPTGGGVTQEQARAIGFDGMLRKPIRQEGLVKWLAGLFGGEAEAAGRAGAPRPRHRSPSPRVSGKSSHILVAGGDGSEIESVSAILSVAGHRVDTTHNGVEAVNAVRNTSYDIILMDAAMPEMDGATATRMIRAFIGSNSAIPIIGMASDASEEDIARLREAGMEEVLSKPVDAAKLETVIARMSAPAQSGAELKPEPLPPAALTVEEKKGLKSLLASLDDIVGTGRR